MKLTYHQICSITLGVSRILDNGSRVSFHRFTQAQQEYYRQTNADFYSKSFATAGVKLRFLTDSAWLRLCYRMTKASSRPYGWFDVYENGVLTEHFGGETAEPLEGSHETQLSSGEKLVEVYFPWSAAAELISMELEDGASLTPVPAGRKMLAFGDSITQGYDAIYPSMSYQCRLAEFLDADCLNKGIGAERFCPELIAEREDISPDLITIAYGTNDWSGRTREDFAENCRGFLARLVSQYPGVPVYVITPLWRADNTRQTPFGAPLSEAVALMEHICAEFPSIRVISGGGFTPRVPEFYSDGYLHPNDLGFCWYARRLNEAITRLQDGQGPQ